MQLENNSLTTNQCIGPRKRSADEFFVNRIVTTENFLGGMKNGDNIGNQL